MSMVLTTYESLLMMMNLVGLTVSYNNNKVRSWTSVGVML